MSDKSDRAFRILGWGLMVGFFLFLLFFLVLMANAQGESAGVTYYVTGDHVRVRAEPNTDSQIVGHYNTGDEVQVAYIESGWALLMDGNYMSAKFLSTEAPAKANEMFVLGPGVRERSSTDTSSDANVICKHEAGESVFVEGDPVDGWYKLVDGGYMSAEFLSADYDDIYRHCAEVYQDIVIVSKRFQKARFYHYKALYADDVVTGHATNSPTPTGLYKVIKKIQGVYLNGNQDTYVAYGVYFLPTYLVHDAETFPWRKTGFGGDIYKTNGSGGCVNTRTAFSEIVWRYSTVDVTYVLILP